MQHTLSYTHVAGSSTQTKTVTETGDGEDNRDLTVLTATNIEVDIDFLVGDVKMFYAQSDRNITLRTNANDATGGDAFAIDASAPLVWHDTGPAASLFTQPVTRMFIQNASGATATVAIRVLRDTTP